MATTTQVNGQTVVHKTSERMVTIFPGKKLVPDSAATGFLPENLIDAQPFLR